MGQVTRYTVIISERAESNLDSIINYLLMEWNVDIKDNFIDRFKKVVSLISKDPYIFQEFSKKKSIRKCLITKHNAMYYRIVKQRVEIITIHDTRRKPSSLKIK